MSHRSDLILPCSCNINIQDPVLFRTISNLLTVIQVEVLKAQYSTTTSDTKSLNTSLLEIMISSKNKRIFIRHLSDLTLLIIFDSWWASMKVHSKQPIAWNNSRHASSWRFHLHSGIEETGCPGIICIVCHQVLRDPSEHGTSSMGKHLLAMEHIAKLNELTVSEVSDLTCSTVDESALPILKRNRCRSIPIVSSQTKFKFNI